MKIFCRENSQIRLFFVFFNNAEGTGHSCIIENDDKTSRNYIAHFFQHELSHINHLQAAMNVVSCEDFLL